jgi:hypothetical protein
MVDDFLELGGGSIALSGCQVCLSANIRRIEAGDITSTPRTFVPTSNG